MCSGCSGIGLESALLFASEGANVVLADVNLPAVQQTALLVNSEYGAKFGVKALAIKADVSNEAQVKAVVDLAVSEFGRLDVMVSLSWFTILCGHSPRVAVQQCRFERIVN